MVRWIGVLVTALAISSAATASAFKDFSRIWEERDQTYRAERESLDLRAKSTADTAVQALVRGEPTAPEDLNLALAAAWSLSELVGRGQALWAFREHISTKPTAALSEAWMQGKVDDLRRRQVEADMIERQIDILKNRDSVSVQQWIAALEQLSMMRGNIYGAAAELALIDRNLASYYKAQSGEATGLAVDLWEGILGAVRSTARRSQDDMQSWSSACARPEGCARR